MNEIESVLSEIFFWIQSHNKKLILERSSWFLASKIDHEVWKDLFLDNFASIWYLHTLCFIRNVYKEQFSWLVKFFKNLRKRLVNSQKNKERNAVWLKISKEQKTSHFEFSKEHV